MDEHRPEVLGGDDDEEALEDLPGPSVLQAARAPEALALASVVLATVSLLGLGLLNGSTYVSQSFSGPAPQLSSLAATALLGAALALLPAALAGLALRRLDGESPWSVVAGAGLLLAGTAFVLRLVIAVRTATDDGAQFVPF